MAKGLLFVSLSPIIQNVPQALRTASEKKNLVGPLLGCKEVTKARVGGSLAFCRATTTN